MSTGTGKGDNQLSRIRIETGPRKNGKKEMKKKTFYVFLELGFPWRTAGFFSWSLKILRRGHGENRQKII
jgi:hypothetical protein